MDLEVIVEAIAVRIVVVRIRTRIDGQEI